MIQCPVKEHSCSDQQSDPYHYKHILNLIDTSNKAKKTFANSFYISAVPHSCKIVFDNHLVLFDHLLQRGPNSPFQYIDLIDRNPSSVFQKLEYL